MEARHLKVRDLLQNAEGKPYPIDRIEMENNRTPVNNFGVEGVHNYFVTESEIWTHNFIGPIVRAIVQGVAKYVAKGTVKSAGKSANAGKVSKGTGDATSAAKKSRSTPANIGIPNSTKVDRDAYGSRQTNDDDS